MSRLSASRQQISQEQIESAAEAYYNYCDAAWTDLDPKARAHYRSRMILALDAFVSHIWRPVGTAPKDGTPVFLFSHMPGRGDYVWPDRWDPEYQCWRTAPHAEPTHWMPVPPPPPPES